MLSSDNIILHNLVVKQPDQAEARSCSNQISNRITPHRVKPKTDPLGCKGIKTHTNTYSEVSFLGLILEIDGDWRQLGLKWR
jgi:hypothetical protein